VGYMRLQKLIAMRGCASRRKAEQLIQEGRVRVNGVVIDKLGSKVEEDADIEIDGTVIKQPGPRVYLMLNKPPGYICSRKDPDARPLIYELVPDRYNIPGLFSIGRLDFMSEGLLLLTNDGDFAQKVIHPSADILKRYIVETNKSAHDNLIDSWKKGVYINGELLRIREYRILNKKKYEIVLTEGRNREIRKLFSSFDLTVLSLKRVAIGSLELGGLHSGKCRVLGERDKALLFKDAH
jgi:23S rRNA pseudouridine2605 synthase